MANILGIITATLTGASLLQGFFGRGKTELVLSQPALTPAEQNLMGQQAELVALQKTLLQDQLAFAKSLQQAGAEELVRSPEEQALVDEIIGELNKRSLAALKGELDVDPRITKEIEIARSELEEHGAATLGPGYKFSQPYIVNKDALERRIADTLEQSRRGLITTNEQLVALREETRKLRAGAFSVLQGGAFTGPLVLNQAIAGIGEGFKNIRQLPLTPVTIPGFDILGPAAQLAGTLYGARQQLAGTQQLAQALSGGGAGGARLLRSPSQALYSPSPRARTTAGLAQLMGLGGIQRLGR